MAPTVSKRAVMAAALALLVVALFGAYKGFRGSTSEADVSATAEGLMPTANAVSARQASALAEPTAAALTEAQIRQIARQEAQAALTAREAPPPAEAAPSEPAAPAPAPAPAPQPAPPPASDANQPPLF